MKAFVGVYSVLLLVASLNSAAAGQIYTTTDNDVRTVAISPSKVVVPAKQSHAKRKTLISNLSDYRYATYFCCSGAGISGPNAQHGFGTFWMALPLTPKADVTLTQIEAPFFTLGGTPSIAVWLAADADGLPGNTIAGPVDVNLPIGFGCCALSTAKFASVPLTKGTRYWIVVGTDSNSTDSSDTWLFNTTDMRRYPIAVSDGTTWTATTGLVPAIGIFGK
jgi:hypothetical protein